jgi:hypothetical protein
LTDTYLLILNCLGKDWDTYWKQDKDSLQFREQVEWGMNAMESANLIIMYFDPSTKSQISLLELGLYAGGGSLVVCCPEGFWRKGNVDIVCERLNIPQVKDLDALVAYVRSFFNNDGK